MSYNSLLINTCDIIHRNLDKWGKVISTTTDSGVKCRIEYKNRLIRDFRGEQVASYALVFFLRTVNLSQNDRLFFGGREWSPLRIELQQNSGSIHHVEVWV